MWYRWSMDGVTLAGKCHRSLKKLLSKGDLKFKKGKQTIHFHSTTQTNTFIIRTILERFQLCIHAAVCVLFDQHYRNQDVIVKARNFPQKTSRT